MLVAPSTGALVARAAAISNARDAATGWVQLQQIPADAVSEYQPFWALSAHLLERLGRTDDAIASYERAIGLCADPVMRAFLESRKRGLVERRTGF